MSNWLPIAVDFYIEYGLILMIKVSVFYVIKSNPHCLMSEVWNVKLQGGNYSFLWKVKPPFTFESRWRWKGLWASVWIRALKLMTAILINLEAVVNVSG